MKSFVFRHWALCCALLLGCACSEESHSVPPYSVPEKPAELTPEPYDWEMARTEIPLSTDLVLLYGGGHHRAPYLWEKSRMADYVTYTDSGQQTHWLFDGFLFLEIMDPAVSGGAGKKFAEGYVYGGRPLEAANRADWLRLIDYYFQSDNGVDALDRCVGEAAAVLGEPASKRRVVISIPEPVVYQTTEQKSTLYWGEVDGRALDFAKVNDRIKACKWFIDTVRARFDQKKYRYVELSGFYWLAEHASQTQDILSTVATYLDDLKYGFNWIPYFNAAGYDRWKSFGFHCAYLQPNYFFSASTPESRLDEACAVALKNDMQMELEFDENALDSRGSGYRLRNYMDAFKRHGIWAQKRLAYYQGTAGLQQLKASGNAADKALYHDFCQFVITRPVR